MGLLFGMLGRTLCMTGRVCENSRFGVEFKEKVL